MNTPTPLPKAAAVIDFGTLKLGNTISDAVAARINAAAPDLPPICWTFWYCGREPLITGLIDDGDVEGLQRWADRLGLTPAGEPLHAGTRAVSGSAFIDHYRHDFRLWCIVDRDAYAKDRTAYRARYGA